jgi:N-alpha-acetyl-L-2,4-diaminobutyrate deacetylase
MPDDDCFLFAENDGLVQLMFDLGDTIKAGDLIARIWPTDRTGVAPIEALAKRGGMLVSRHFPGLIQSGDCLAVIADIVES